MKKRWIMVDPSGKDRYTVPRKRDAEEEVEHHGTSGEVWTFRGEEKQQRVVVDLFDKTTELKDLSPMRKYRVVVSAGGRKHTRHVRAADRTEAETQASMIAAALSLKPLSGAEAAVLGAPAGACWTGSGTVLEVVEMGNVGRRFA